jgi:hypothetical protein
MVCLESEGETSCGLGTAAGCCAAGSRCDVFGRCVAVNGAVRRGPRVDTGSLIGGIVVITMMIWWM